MLSKDLINDQKHLKCVIDTPKLRSKKPTM